ncbi:MAG: chromosome partition protein [Actinomycetota bacterium]
MLARVDALTMALANQGGGAVLLAAAESVPGVLGSVTSLIKVRSGFEDAIAIALGDAADAVVVSDLDAAVAAFTHLKSSDAGRAGVVIANSGASTDWNFNNLPASAVLAREVVDAPEHIRNSIVALLRNVVVVESLAEARQVVAHNADAVAVTTSGDVLGAAGGAGGSSSAPSLLQMQSALDDARTKSEALADTLSRLKFELVTAAEAVKEATREADARLSVLHESDAEMAAVAEQLGHLASTVRNANAEAERLKNALGAATSALDADNASLTELEQRFEAAEQADVETEPSTVSRDRFAGEVEMSRQAEVDARLAVRTNEERQSAATTTADNLERAARDERESRRRFAERKERRAREAAVASSVLKGAQIALSWLEVSLQLASNERTQAEAARDARDAEISTVRGRIRELSQELERLVSDVHRDEVARAEQRLRIEALENKAMEELGLDADTLISEFGPHNLVPPSPPAPGDEVDPNAPAPEPYPYVREQQEKRLKQAERGLNLLGKVNPLALEEFAALEERHQFLNAQLDDLRKSKNDLMAIIKDVDERVQQVFAEAFADTAREFEGIFSRLFPGGEGRLVLTNPDDLLTTGIEVEARPPGKKLKRLSLLSGGERSLTAVAFLVALFKSRPSPFYVMDEVEAALDDVNLGRLIEVMKELQDSSQLIVITHQKRTMEIADALYGVTMRGDGVSAVISQRLADVRDSA